MLSEKIDYKISSYNGYNTKILPYFFMKDKQIFRSSKSSSDRI